MKREDTSEWEQRWTGEVQLLGIDHVEGIEQQQILRSMLERGIEMEDQTPRHLVQFGRFLHQVSGGLHLPEGKFGRDEKKTVSLQLTVGVCQPLECRGMQLQGSRIGHDEETPTCRS